MDLSIPYTFYPSALPASLAWVLFLTALFGAGGIGLLLGRKRNTAVGFLAAIPAFALLLFISMVFSMVLMFFIHDV
ncbi:MAG: hypothetical protein WBF93_19210 [Pirellulales bacterium]